MLLAGGVEPQRAAWALDALVMIVTAKAVETVVGQGRREGAPPYDKDELRRTFSELPADRFPNLVIHAVERPRVGRRAFPLRDRHVRRRARALRGRGERGGRLLL